MAEDNANDHDDAVHGHHQSDGSNDENGNNSNVGETEMAFREHQDVLQSLYKTMEKEQQYLEKGLDDLSVELELGADSPVDINAQIDVDHMMQLSDRISVNMIEICGKIKGIQKKIDEFAKENRIRLPSKSGDCEVIGQS